MCTCISYVLAAALLLLPQCKKAPGNAPPLCFLVSWWVMSKWNPLAYLSASSWPLCVCLSNLLMA